MILTIYYYTKNERDINILLLNKQIQLFQYQILLNI
jgi:hypothetical protein